MLRQMLNCWKKKAFLKTQPLFILLKKVKLQVPFNHLRHHRQQIRTICLTHLRHCEKLHRLIRDLKLCLIWPKFTRVGVTVKSKQTEKISQKKNQVRCHFPYLWRPKFQTLALNNLRHLHQMKIIYHHREGKMRKRMCILFPKIMQQKARYSHSNLILKII